MYLEFYNNNGSRSVRIVRASYEPNAKGVMTSKKKFVKFLGPVSRFDDGKPDFEARMREDFKNRRLKIDGFDYDEAEQLYSSKTKELIVVSFQTDQYPRLHLQNYGYFLLDSIFEQLGIGDILRKYKSNSKIQYDLVNVIKLLVYSRFIQPGSKRGPVYCQNDHPWLFFDHSFPDQNIWYRSLSVLNELDSKIQLRMNTKIQKSKTGRKYDTMYYYITNCSFEIPYPDEPTYLYDENGCVVNDEFGNPIVVDPGLPEKIKSKEKRHLPLAQIGLFMDENGLPAHVRAFPGNTADPTPCLEVLNSKGFDSFGIERMVLIADNAMNSRKIFYELVSQDHGYIVPKSVLKSSSDVKQWILEDKDWVTTFQEKDLNNSINDAMNEKKETGKERQGDAVDRTEKEDDEYPQEQAPKITFNYKSRIVETSAEIHDPNGKLLRKNYRVKQCVYWSYAHYRKDVHEGEKLREELRQAKDHPSLLKEKDRRLWEYMTADLVDSTTGNLLKDATVVIRILEDKLNEQEKLFGYFMIETTELDIHEIVILGKYRDLSGIENSFRVCKSDFDLRPMFVSTGDHMKAHVLICFIALTIMRIIQNKIMVFKGIPVKACSEWSYGLSEERIKIALTDCMAALVSGSYYMLNDMSQDQELLFAAFEIPKVEVATEGNIRKMRTAINHYLI